MHELIVPLIFPAIPKNIGSHDFDINLPEPGVSLAGCRGHVVTLPEFFFRGFALSLLVKDYLLAPFALESSEIKQIILRIDVCIQVCVHR